MGNKTLTSKKIFDLNFGLLGLYFAWILQMANTSGIFSLFGAEHDDLGKLWLALPLGGLVTQLFIGFLSDRTSSPLGSKLPYVLGGAIFTAFSMFLLPNASSLTSAVILLWLFTVAINVTMQPFRAFVADVAPPQSYIHLYAMQTIFVGIGSIFAAAFPWVLSHTFAGNGSEDTIPLAIKISFYSGGVLLLLSNLWTVLACKKYLIKTSRNQPPETKPLKSIKENLQKSPLLKELLELFFKKMPKVMRQVSLVQLFTWFGIFCFMVYLTPVIEKNIIQYAHPVNLLNDVSRKESIDKSLLLTNLAYVVYMSVNIAFAYCIPLLTRWASPKYIHAAALFLGGTALLALMAVHSTIFLLIAMIGVGIAWSSLISLPFAMIIHALPQNKLGFYMGAFNVAICVPQIIASLVIEPLLGSVLHQNVLYIMLISSICLLIAALLTAFYVKEHVDEQITRV